jgi:hypothetical protein
MTWFFTEVVVIAGTLAGKKRREGVTRRLAG